MSVISKKVDVFKVTNRAGYAAICENHLTEGDTKAQALERMEKALLRTAKKTTKK